MCHRIRAALIDEDFQKLMGIVEVDETFVGGLAKNRHKDKRGDGEGGTGGMLGQSHCCRRCQPQRQRRRPRHRECPRRDPDRISFAKLFPTKVSLLCTDQWAGYKHLNEEYPHATIDHARGQYVVGAIHTQTIEGFWSLFKRGMVGTFHKVSKKYLPLYVAEFQFRYNNRENADIFETAIRECQF